MQFWVAQFLMDAGPLDQPVAGPVGTLQAVLLFDEADLYLPAVRQPPTKEPMEDLLAAGRSAGLGLLLATQSPATSTTSAATTSAPGSSARSRRRTRWPR